MGFAHTPSLFSCARSHKSVESTIRTTLKVACLPKQPLEEEASYVIQSSIFSTMSEASLNDMPVPPIDVVQFDERSHTESKLDSPPHDLAKVVGVGERPRPTSDDGTISTATTLRTAEETWFEDYCESEDFIQNASNSPASSPLESQRKTIALPRPIRRHRRISSAVPRLQSSPGELPPLPPKRSSTSSISSVSSPKAAAPLRKHANSWDATQCRPSSKKTVPQKPSKSLHRRTLSSPLAIDLSQEFSSLGLLLDELEDSQKRYGTKDSRVATVWNLIGNTHVKDGNDDAAIAAYKEAVKCDPGDHLAESYGNMGTVFFKIGKVDECIVFFKNALRVHEYNVILEEGDPSRSLKIATVQYQIGLAQTLRREYDEAFVALKRACEIQSLVLGEKHAEIAKTLDAIGKVYLLRKNYRAALACHEEALAIKRESSADKTSKNQAMLTTLQNIAVVHVASMDMDSAMSAYVSVLEVQKKLINSGSDSFAWEAAKTLAVLADLFRDRRMLEEARSCLLEADLILDEAGINCERSFRILLSQKLISL